MEATPRSRDDAATLRPEAPALGFNPWHLLWLLSPLFFLLLRGAQPWVPDIARAYLGLVGLVILPGWQWHQILLPRPRVGFAARVTRAFLLGVGWNALLGMAIWFAGGGAHLGPVTLPSPAAPGAGRLVALLWAVPLGLVAGGLFLAARPWLARRGARPGSGRGGAAASGSAAHREGEARTDIYGYAGRSAEAIGSVPGPREGEPPASAAAQRARRGMRAAGVVVRSEPDAVRDGDDPWQRILRRAYELGEEQKRERVIAPRWAALIVLTMIVIVTALLAFHAGGNFGYATDSPDHIASIREMVECNRVLPRTVFHADGDGPTVDPRKGFFHVILAGLAMLTGISAPRLWMLSPGLLVPFALILFHTLARRVLRSEGTALFATFLAVICFGEVNRGLFARLAYGNYMGVVLSWGVLALALRYVLGDCRRGMLACLAVAALGAAATHAFSLVAILFSLGAFALGLLLVRGPRHQSLRRVLRALGAVLIGIAPITAWRLLFASGSANLIHTHRQGVVYLTDSLFIVSPFEWARFLGGVGFAGILLACFLFRRLRESDAVVYLVTLSFAPLLVLLNPWLTVWLEPHFGYLIARFALLVPFLLVLAYVAGWMSVGLLRIDSWRRVVTALGFYALMLLLLFPRLDAFARSYSTANLERLGERSILQWSDVLQRLDRELPAPAVVLSDPLTSYAIPALTRHRSVCVLHQHGSPADSLALERLAGSRDVLSPYIGTGEKARICRRFSVDYVLLNADFPRRRHLFFCSVGPAIAVRQARALEADRALLRTIWDLGDAGALYAVRAENLDLLSGIVKPGERTPAHPSTETRTHRILMRTLPADARPVLPDTIAGVTLAAIDIERPVVARGEQLGLTLFWRRVGEPPPFPLQTHLRMDARSPRDWLWTYRFSKLHRLLHERLEGQTYRLREEEVPLDGLFGCEHWPRDRYVVDRVEIPIPTYAVSGEYRLQVTWMEETFLPNLPLRHFLSDDDAYRGETVGLIEVY